MTKRDPTAKFRHVRGSAYKFLMETVIHHSGSECLIWPLGRNDAGGYASIRDQRTKKAFGTVIVSRIVCEITHGKAPGPTFEAAHSCGNGHLGCVNPRHLSWKTRVANQADKLLHGTANRGERHGMSKLTTEQVREIKRDLPTHTQAELARRYGVTDNAIYHIAHGDRWQWLEP